MQGEGDAREGMPAPLRAGYERFRRERFPSESVRYEMLASGQAPTTMIVGCADSRVDPATIFSAAPGELFVVRNVANLVPPPDSTAGYHGTSAALEFAVTGLEVGDIVVLGHGLCGGVAASLQGAGGGESYIGAWVALLDDMRAEVMVDGGLENEAARQRALEFAAIMLSLENLRRFPFVAEREGAGTLRLHGAWFSIAEGALYWLDANRGGFCPVA